MRARAAAGVVAGVLGLLVLAASPALAATLPSGFQDEPVISGLTEPSAFRFAPDGRVFVAEKSGLIFVYSDLDDTSPELFADLRTEAYDTGDRGILGLALDPEFAAGRPYVYVLYTYDHILGDPAPAPRWGEPETSGDPCPELKGADACLVSGRLVKLTADGDQAVEGPGGAPLQDVLIEDWCQQFSSHSIGDLQFGAEGALYASGGDGASFSATDIGQLGSPPNPCGDPLEEGGALRAQDIRTTGDPTGLNGTVIRIDPDTGKAWPGNPLSGPDENARRIVAAGLRNPFRFGIDPDTHEVYAGNVGWNDYEEIERFNPDSGEVYNSGWPCYEGPERQANYENAEVDICEDLYAEPGGASPPFFSYVHREDVVPGEPCTDFRGSAISGINFYEDGPFPDLYDGAMFFADSVRGCIFYMLRGSDGRPDPSTVTAFMHHSDPYSGVDLEVGPDGDLYYASFFTEEGGNEFEPGAIHRIHYSSGNQPPVARLSVDEQWSDPGEPLDATFDASGSTDADDDPLEYEWDLDGDGDYNDAPDEDTATESFDDEENHTVAVRVVDPDEGFSVARVTVFPGDTPPEPTISSPQASFRWSVGGPVSLEGSAEDAEDGNLPSTSLDWVTRMAHCPDPAQPDACHAHPLQAFPDVAAATFLAPDHDYPSHIELLLTAVDSRGLAARRSIEIDPRTVDLEIASNPPGVNLTAGLLTGPAPFDLTVIRGSDVVVSAPASTLFEGTLLPWLSWSDGGARVHSFAANNSGRYVAKYLPDPPDPPGPTDQRPLPSSGSDPAGGGPPPPGRLQLRKHPGKRTQSRKATFAFSFNGAAAGFRCRIDRKPAAPCESPKTYRRLAPGAHTFRVVPIDDAGRAVVKAVSFSWKVITD